MRNFITCILLTSFSLTIHCQTGIHNTINSILAKPSMEFASMSISVYDLDADSAIVEHNSKSSLVPASTMKLFSTAVSLAKLGSYKSFKTHLYYQGEIDSNCVLNGDIIIVGGGDPTLGSKFFNNENTKRDFLKKWSDEISQLGIDSIHGNIIADASYYSDEMVPGTWAWVDMGNYYGAGPTGITIFDNTMKLIFKSGMNAGDSTWIIRTEPSIPNLKIDNQVISSNVNSDNAYVYGAPYSLNRYVTGTIPKNRSEFEVKASMHHPAMILSIEMKNMLDSFDIKVSGHCHTSRDISKSLIKDDSWIEISTISSPTLNRIVYMINHHSVNLFAEHLVLELGRKTYGNGSTGSGTAAITNYLSKYMNTSGLTIADGSGLSRFNAVSAYHFTQLLRFMKKSKYYKSFYNSLPIAGKSGTLSSIGKGTYIQGKLRAKSGTMSRVKSYAGYVKSKSGKNLAFAIISNNHTCSANVIKGYMQQIMVSIGNY